MFRKIHNFKSLISRKCHCHLPNDLVHYTCMSCANLSVKSLLRSWLLQFQGIHSPSKVPLPVGDLNSWFHGFNTQCQTSDVVENLGRYVSCLECTAKRKDFELILTIKMETRHHVQGHFQWFPAICITAELWRPKVARLEMLWAIFAFFKRPLMVKFSQFCSKRFDCLTDRRCCFQMS